MIQHTIHVAHVFSDGLVSGGWVGAVRYTVVLMRDRQQNDRDAECVHRHAECTRPSGAFHPSVLAVLGKVRVENGEREKDKRKRERAGK